MIHMGKILEDFLKERRITKTELGREIGRECVSVMNYLKNDSIQLRVLYNISHAVKHNFFQDIADTLPADFTVKHDVKSGKDKRIAELEEENKVLRIQNEVLMRIRSQG